MEKSEQVLALMLELRYHGVKEPSILKFLETVDDAIFPFDPFERDFPSIHYNHIEIDDNFLRKFVSSMLCYKLNIAKTDAVLEVGCGGGLQTALIASIAKRVTTICATKSEKEQADKSFNLANIRNAFAVRNDFGLGWPVQAPFDKIIVNVPCGELPVALISQLTMGGVMLYPSFDDKLPRGQYMVNLLSKESDKNVIKQLFPMDFALKS